MVDMAQNELDLQEAQEQQRHLRLASVAEPVTTPQVVDVPTRHAPTGGSADLGPDPKEPGSFRSSLSTGW